MQYRPLYQLNGYEKITTTGFRHNQNLTIRAAFDDMWYDSYESNGSSNYILLKVSRFL